MLCFLSYVETEKKKKKNLKAQKGPRGKMKGIGKTEEKGEGKRGDQGGWS
jgi:hypothetical protein